MSAFGGKADIRLIACDVCFSNRPVMGWTRRAPALRSRKPAWGYENQEHPMPRATSSTNVIATIGIDIGKNALFSYPQERRPITPSF